MNILPNEVFDKGGIRILQIQYTPAILVVVEANQYALIVVGAHKVVFDARFL